MDKIEKKIVGWKVASNSTDITKGSDNTFLDLNFSTEEAVELRDKTDMAILEEKKKLELATIRGVTPVRPRRLDNTWRLRPPHAEHSLRVTLVANITPEGKKVPYEILLNTKNPETFMHLQAHALVISSYFREAYKTGISLNSLIQTLKDVFDPKYPSYRVRLKDSDEKPTLVHSIVAEIGYVIEEFYGECLAWNYSNSSHENLPSKAEKEIVKANFDTTTTESSLLGQWQVAPNLNPCPKCGSPLTKQSGCDLCLDCGYSKCS